MTTFILVGHCVPDQFMLRSAVQRLVPDAAVEIVNDHSSLEPHLHPEAVLLVNRVLDGRFHASDGIDLIDALNGNGPRTLLISNLADAQTRAEAAGAMPGFGKSDLYEDATAEKLRAAVVTES